MSNQFKQSTTFVDDNNPEIENSKGSQPFEMNELQGAGGGRDRSFSYQSETARNFDQANVNKAKDGVKELMADVITKAKSRAVEIKDQARQEGYKAGYDTGFQKGEDAAREEFSPFLETIHTLIKELNDFRTMMYSKEAQREKNKQLDKAKKKPRTLKKLMRKLKRKNGGESRKLQQLILIEIHITQP